MPPRIALPSSQWVSLTLPIRPRLDPSSLPFRQFSTSQHHNDWRSNHYLKAQRVAHQLAVGSRKKKKAAARLKELAAEAPPEPGSDPVYGLPTPFVQSFDEPAPAKVDILTGKSSRANIAATTTAAAVATDAAARGDSSQLNFRLERDAVRRQLQLSKFLSSPSAPERAELSIVDEPSAEALAAADAQHAELVRTTQAEHEAAHAQAERAIERILRLELGSSKDRMRVNFDRCIAHFGRHNTDATLLSKNGEKQEVKERIGKDVGSSEVQIALLTVKIRNLANNLSIRGKKDHHNKRNLRLLVHKRQKMLKYLRRKERGGPRWQHVINTLGLTEATWKGEIVV